MSVYVELLKLVVIFSVIVLGITLKRPLYQAILSGIVVTMLLYRITPIKSVVLVGNVLSVWFAKHFRPS